MELALWIERDPRVHVLDLAFEIRRIHNGRKCRPDHLGLLLAAATVAVPIWRPGRGGSQNGSSTLELREI
jgi:hypothetical protein